MRARRVLAIVAAVSMGVVASPGERAAAADLECSGRAVTMRGTAADDVIVGTPGPDVIHGLGGDDVLRGGDGDDVICGGDGDDRLAGSDGDDVLGGGSGDDGLSGGSGDDELAGRSGRDYLDGGAGEDLLRGGPTPDPPARPVDGVLPQWLRGGPGDDVLVGGSGSDVLMGGNGDDRLRGGGSSDSLLGGGGHDLLLGGDADDQIWGGNGQDDLRGDAGDDELHGGHGRDGLDGGTGVDRCNGGTGASRFGSCEDIWTGLAEQLHEARRLWQQHDGRRYRWEYQQVRGSSTRLFCVRSRVAGSGKGPIPDGCPRGQSVDDWFDALASYSSFVEEAEFDPVTGRPTMVVSSLLTIEEQAFEFLDG